MKRAFTLLEMLAAMTVLAVILLIVTQITNHTTRVVQNTRRMDADSEARLVFNRLALDFSRMLRRPDLDCSAFKKSAADPDQIGNDRLAFYAENPAAESKFPLTLIACQVNRNALNDSVPNVRNPELQRLAEGLDWEPSNNRKSITYLPLTLDLGELFTLSDKYQSLGRQIFRFEYTYLLKPSGAAPARLSNTPADSLGNVAAIVVTIGVLDETSRKIVAEAKYDQLIEIFPDAADGDTPAAEWNRILNEPDFPTRTGVPLPASSRVRIYERYFYLP